MYKKNFLKCIGAIFMLFPFAKLKAFEHIIIFGVGLFALVFNQKYTIESKFHDLEEECLFATENTADDIQIFMQTKNELKHNKESYHNYYFYDSRLHILREMENKDNNLKNFNPLLRNATNFKYHKAHR